MSMIGNLLLVSQAELEEYITESTKLENRVYNNPGTDPNLVDIDKAWAGILFLLTGKNFDDVDCLNHPLSKVFFTDQLIDENQDMGYGPANYLTPAQVAQINKQISTLTETDFR